MSEAESLKRIMEANLEVRGAIQGMYRVFQEEQAVGAQAAELVARALPLVGYAVDIPGRELEAQEWLGDARAFLKL